MNESRRRERYAARDDASRHSDHKRAWCFCTKLFYYTMRLEQGVSEARKFDYLS